MSKLIITLTEEIVVRCMELAGVDSPHRRSHADSSAYVLSMDLVGPYPVGRDDGRRRNGKYIMVATVPLPDAGA